MDAGIRDYRDETDVDEILDLIRVAEREEAHKLLRLALDHAYSQGRRDCAATIWEIVGETVR